MTIRFVVRAVVVAVAVLGLAAGCSSEQGQELASSKSDEYYHPVWVGDSVYYLVRAQDDSDSPSLLMRVRAGHSPERVTVEYPDCRDSNGLNREPSDIVAIDDHELGLIMHCEQSSFTATPSAFVRWDIDSGRPATIAKIEYSSAGVAWSADSGTVYFPAYSCPLNRLSAVGGRPSTCFGGPDALFPAVAADGSVVYLTSQCGTDAAEPQSTSTVYSVCRHDGQGGASTIARGVRGPAALAVHGDRVVVAGEVHGESGVWLVTAGRFERLATGSDYYRGAAFNADGTRLAVAVRDKGWFSMTWSLRVIAVPRS